MRNNCLKLAIFTLLGAALLSVFSQKALAKDSFVLNWTVQATPSAMVVDLSNDVYYAGYVASPSAVQFNPFYLSDPTHQASDAQTATTGGIFLSQVNGVTYKTPTYLWQPDQPGNPIGVTKIATDSAQNVYLLGYFSGTMNLDPIPGGPPDFWSAGTGTWPFLTEISKDGVYVGTTLWQDSNITLRDMVIDKNDNIFLLGRALNNGNSPITVNLDPSGSDLQSLSPGDTLGFYTKMAAGAPQTYAYSRTLKNVSSQRLEMDHLAVNSAGNVFILGVFNATTQMNFNIGNGGNNFKTSNNNSDDLYLSEYAASGDYAGTYIVGGPQNESAETLAIDNNDNVYYAGSWNSTVNFNPIDPTKPDNKTAGVGDQRFLSEIKSDGSYGRTVSWNSNSLTINKIAFDQNNAMYLVGVSGGTINFDPTGGTDSHQGLGANDAFMTVFNPDQTYNYTYVWGGNNNDKAMDIAFDSANNALVTGSTKSNSLNFDPTGITNIPTTFLTGGEWGYLSTFSWTQQVPVPTAAPTPTPGPSNGSNNSNNNNSSSGGGGGPTTFTCTSHVPVAPKIFQIWATKSNATVYFVPSADPQDTYTVSYGLYSDAEMYNVTFSYSDKSGAIPYTINALGANTTYYFKVRANNGCMPGSWSNTLNLKTAYSGSGGNTAYASSNASLVSNNPSSGAASTGGSCSQYTVLPGDSLWKVAQKVLGAGNKYLQVWNANKGKFPTLNTSSTIRTGWTLSVGC